MSMWAHIQCPLTLELVCTLTVLNGGMVTFCMVHAGPLTLLRQNSLTSMGSPLGEEWITSFSTPVSFELAWGSCSNPYMTAPKWACLHVVVTLQAPLGHCAYGPIYDFRSNHDQDHLRICCGWYNQQQHILIVVFGPWDLEVDLQEPEVWDGGTPCTPQVPITDPGAGYAVQSPYKIGSLCWKPECLNQLVQSFPAHPLSLGPH